MCLVTESLTYAHSIFYSITWILSVIFIYIKQWMKVQGFMHQSLNFHVFFLICRPGIFFCQNAFIFWMIKKMINHALFATGFGLGNDSNILTLWCPIVQGSETCLVICKLRALAWQNSLSSFFKLFWLCVLNFSNSAKG